MEPQQFVLEEAEAADGRVRFWAAVRAMPIILLCPNRQRGGSLIRGLIIVHSSNGRFDVTMSTLTATPGVSGEPLVARLHRLMNETGRREEGDHEAALTGRESERETFVARFAAPP